MKLIVFVVYSILFPTFSFAEESPLLAAYKKKPEQKIRIWSEIDGERQRAKISSIALKSDGEKLLSADKDGTVVLWDLATKTRIWSAAPAEPTSSSNVFFLNEEKWAGSLGKDGKLRILNANDGKTINTITVPSHTDTIKFVAPTSGLTFLVGTWGDKRVSLVTLGDDAAVEDVEHIVVEEGTGTNAIAITTDQKRIAVAARRAATRVYDIGEDTKPLELELKGETDVLSFSVAGDLATGQNWEDKRVHIWEKNGNLKHSLGDYTFGVKQLLFSPDSKFLFAAGSQQTYNLSNSTPADIWDVTTGKLVQSLKLPSLGEPRNSLHVSGLALSQDGKRLVLSIWDNGESYSIESDLTPAIFVFDF